MHTFDGFPRILYASSVGAADGSLIGLVFATSLQGIRDQGSDMQLTTSLFVTVLITIYSIIIGLSYLVSVFQFCQLQGRVSERKRPNRGNAAATQLAEAGTCVFVIVKEKEDGLNLAPSMTCSGAASWSWRARFAGRVA